MSRVLEHHVKTLLAQHGVAVPASLVLDTKENLGSVESTLGYPLVIKALVPAGKRARAGGVRVVAGREELTHAVSDLLGAVVGGYTVDRLLAEQFIEVDRECFLSISYDSLRRGPCVTLGSVGGVEIEALARTGSGQRLFAHLAVDPLASLDDAAVRTAWTTLGLAGPAVDHLVAATRGAWDTWVACEGLLLEINPLGLLADGRACAVGALLRLDDDALFRHGELAAIADPGNDRSWRTPTLRERQVLAADAAEPYRGTVRYTEMPDGDVGNCGAGGGGSLLTFDLLLRYGLSPANYGEFGGNPSAEKVAALVRAILSRPGVRALLVNSPITNNTRTDEVARGIIRSVRELGVNPTTFPIVIRMAGVNDEQAARLLAEAGFMCLGEEATMEDAVANMAARLLEDPRTGEHEG